MAPNSPAPTVLTADRVLPMSGPPLTPGAVLVEGERITAVGPVPRVLAQAPPGTRRLDHPGCTVLPGLINGHVHLVFDATPEFLDTFRRADDAELRTGIAARLDTLLRTGVTTVRDLGDRDGLVLAVRAELRERAAVAPRLLAAGTPITLPEGHCHFFGGAVESDADILSLVDKNAAAGADVIKVMASGGQITPGGADMWDSQFDAERLAVIVRRACEHGLPVAAHAHGADAIAAAVTAGVSTVEHCTWMTGPGRVEVREPVVAAMADRGIAACSTSSRNWRTLVDRIGEELGRTVYGRLRTLDEAGVPLLAGTDSGLVGSVFDDQAGSLTLYEWLGFPAERILRLATVDSAAALGLAEVTGALRPGLAADVLVVGGNPLTDGMSTLSDVRRVLAAGHEPT